MSQTAKLIGGNNWMVGISGDTIVTGSPENIVAQCPGSGSAYVYVKPAGGWADMTQTAVLKPGAGQNSCFNNFGYNIAIDNATIMTGFEDGTAFLFKRPAGGWEDMTQTAVITLPSSAGFGFSASPIAVRGTTVVAGAPMAKVGSNQNQGEVYVFEIGSGNGPCPAVKLYGESSPEVAALRALRDNVLAKSAAGGLLVRLYYKLAPAAEHLLDASPRARQACRLVFDGILSALR